jgi:pimeloyl-ACP methyl ester carboxylesterase
MMWNAPDPTPLTCAALSEVTAPTTVIFGSKTFPAFKLAANAIADCIPSARLAKLDGVGHIGPVVAEEPFVALVRERVDAQ